MATEERKKEILEKMKKAVIEYDEDAAKEGAQEALDEGVKANDAIFRLKEHTLDVPQIVGHQ